MTTIETAFNGEFARWGIVLPPGDVQAHARGKIVEAGWAIWYVFNVDEKGEYLDYYASHRMTGDAHVRIRDDGSCEHLPAICGLRVCSEDPEEDARLEAEYFAENQAVSKMLEEKGFGIQGDEPGGVQINRFLHLQKLDDATE